VALKRREVIGYEALLRVIFNNTPEKLIEEGYEGDHLIELEMLIYEKIDNIIKEKE